MHRMERYFTTFIRHQFPSNYGISLNSSNDFSLKANLNRPTLWETVTSKENIKKTTTSLILAWLTVALEIFHSEFMLKMSITNLYYYYYYYYILLTSGIASQGWCHRWSIVRRTSCSGTLCAVFMASARTQTQDPWISSPERWPLHHTALHMLVIFDATPNCTVDNSWVEFRPFMH